MSSAKTSPTLVLNEKIQSLWNEGKDVLHLGFGESRFPTHPLLKNALAKVHRIEVISHQPALKNLKILLPNIIQKNYQEPYLQTKFLSAWEVNLCYTL